MELVSSEHWEVKEMLQERLQVNLPTHQPHLLYKLTIGSVCNVFVFFCIRICN